MRFDPEKLKKYRLKAGLTHRRIAVLIDAPVAIISRWETGKHDPSLKHFLNLQKLFKQSLISATDETKEEEEFQQMLLLPPKEKSNRKQAS